MSEYLNGLLSDGSFLFALPVALLAGVVAGLNPCCLPMYPAAAGCCTALRKETVRGNLWTAAGFILGGSLVTTVLGVLSGLAGSVFGGLASWPVYIIAALPLVFGLHLLGVVSIPLPSLDTRARRKPRGHLAAVVAGALFGLVITPCATPVLAGLLAYVASTGSPVLGGLLLFVYGLGLGIPILLIGTAAASFVARLATERARRVAEHVTGAVLVALSLYLVWIA